MTIPSEVHWEEGLFLRPHHLQWMQRQSFQRESALRGLFHVFPYGVIEAKPSREELENLMVRFDRLQVMMPSGLYVDVPGNAELPPRDVKKVFEASSSPITVSIGVPLWYPNRGNAFDGGPGSDWRVKRLWGASELPRPDENTGENEQPIRVRRINARLILDGEDDTDLELVPLVQLVHAEGEESDLPRQRADFVPPCLVLHGNAQLTGTARDLANAVDAARRELLDQLTRGGFSVETIRGPQFEQLLRFRTLSRAAARLTPLVETRAIAPFDMYLELRGLLAELSALRPDRESPPAPEYEHDRPLLSISELSERIRPLLRWDVAGFLKIDFHRDGAVFRAEITDDHFRRATDFYLAIRTQADPTALARMVCNDDEFKLMPESLTGRMVRGVKLVEERHPPLQLPADAALHYFRLVPADSPRTWALVQTDKRVTAQWAGSDVAEYKLALYMPVSGAGSKA